MSHARFLPRSPLLFTFTLASLLWVSPAQAAKSRNAQNDSGPVLLSQTGGGDAWADLKELQAAVSHGNPRAEAQLGEMLLRGEGIDKNETRAVELLEKSARAGHPPAAFRLGMLLMDGQAGVAKDPGRALDYFRAAAAGGEAEAFFNIGAAHANGRGVRRNYAEALGWLIVAKERGAQSDAEAALRAQLKTYPKWITTGEQRAKEIVKEFEGKKVTDLLPPVAPLDKPFDALRPALPTPAAARR